MEIEALTGSFFLCLGLTYGLRHLAIKLDVISQSDFRRDGRRIPLLGGLGIFVSIAAVGSFLLPWEHMVFFFCTLPLVLVGLIDDIKEISPKFKFFAQACSALLFLSFIPKEQLFLNSLGVHFVATYIISFFWLIGLTNAVNFIDGIDGQAATYATVVFLALYMTSRDPHTSNLLLIATGGTVGFMMFNLPPAKIFLGEIGSSLLGFMVAYFTILHTPNNPQAFNLLGLLFLAAFPLTDVILSVSRRMKKRLTPFSGDRDHIHHKLRKIGLAPGSTLLISGSVTVFCGITAYVLSRVSDLVVGSLLGVMATAALVSILLAIYYLEFRLGHQISKYSKTLIDKHLHPHSNVNYDPQNFHAVLIDLLPYYKELQQAGFPVVDSFILEFAEVVKKFSLDRGQIQSAGIYSVVVVFAGREWTQIEKKRLEKSLFNLTKKFGVVKNATERPDGLYYFSTQNPNKYIRVLDNRRIGLRRKAS